MNLDDPSSEPSPASDVEDLLAQIDEQAAGKSVPPDAGEKKPGVSDSVQPYDFRHPVFLSPKEIRKLRAQHDDYIQSLATRLSSYLRLDIGLQLSKLQTLGCQKFIESVGTPANIVLFKVEPLRGICIIEVSPRLAFTFVDRLMGGPGHTSSLNRDLTEIEVALLDQVVEIIISEWCVHWAGLIELRPSILGHENSGRFLTASQASSTMLSVSLEARVGDCVEQIKLGIPFPILEPILHKLNAELDAAAVLTTTTPPVSPRWKKDYDEVSVPLSAEWIRLRLSARELTRLKVGDILQWDVETAGRVMLRLARRPKFEGRLGTRGKKWAVEITNVLKP